MELFQWITSHADLMAWTVGWVAALGATQLAKLYIPSAASPTKVKQILHIVAILTGGFVAYMTWPDSGLRALGFAISSGLSAPAGYTLAMAILQTLSPRVAKKLTWDHLSKY